MSVTVSKPKRQWRPYDPAVELRETVEAAVSRIEEEIERSKGKLAELVHFAEVCGGVDEAAILEARGALDWFEQLEKLVWAEGDANG